MIDLPLSHSTGPGLPMDLALQPVCVDWWFAPASPTAPTLKPFAKPLLLAATVLAIGRTWRESNLSLPVQNSRLESMRHPGCGDIGIGVRFLPARQAVWKTLPITPAVCGRPLSGADFQGRDGMARP